MLNIRQGSEFPGMQKAELGQLAVVMPRRCLGLAKGKIVTGVSSLPKKSCFHDLHELS